MPSYYVYGEVLLLQVPMDNVLNTSQKDKIAKLLKNNDISISNNWYETEDFNVDAEYSEVLGGYIIFNNTYENLLSDLFNHSDPVEPQGVFITEKHNLNNDVKLIAEQANLVWCNVAYVRMKL